MKCPKCQFDNREGAKFCGKCRTALSQVCPNCNSENPPENTFCDECGQELAKEAETEKTAPEPEGERKHVTVLFSDLSGYTALSENLDPEEVKEITSRLFAQISKVIAKYKGFIEKFVGDAVMALFGAPKAHEDDPIRAIKAAREIHELVDIMSPQLENKIGRPLSMHSGINTGLVVTGEVNVEKGTHGLTGDAINLASRLQGLAKDNEILVGEETYRQTEGHFSFEVLGLTKVKGREDRIRVYKVLSVKEKPVTIHRLSGLRASLIGRKAEIAIFSEAIEQLRNGQRRVFSIWGDAGTGKSRLVEEFKSAVNLEGIKWLESHAYPYSQNVPYSPLIDLLNQVFHIEEGDSSENVKEKVEAGIDHLLGKNDIVPFVGNLYSLSYPELEDMSPDFFELRLQEAVQSILSALAKRNPTVFFLEDLHWADPSFVKLVRRALLEMRQPAIVLCAYRPEFNLFSGYQLDRIGKFYQEIRLQNLSFSHVEDMLESLLDSQSLPSDLRKFVQQKAEGNPFYVEELVNSLIESEVLVRDNGNWKITRSIVESEISPTIHGLISGRLDRLGKRTKRTLQEASVIGRAFLYEILKKITDFEESIDRDLGVLEKIDLIRARSLQPELEYMFKHPLTHEVVYNGILKKDRRIIHEQIAIVMEHIFRERLPEFYETLAFHFKQGQSLEKAIHYLMKAAEKSAKRNAVQESHQFYKEAFDLLAKIPERTKEEDCLLIDLIIEWAFVFSYRGDFKGLDELLKAHMDLARSLGDKARLGVFIGWVGVTLWFRDRYREAYEYLEYGLKLGEESGSQEVIGDVCTWLCYVSAELGLLDEAIQHGERAHAIAKSLKSDPWLYIKSLHSLSYAYSFRGDKQKVMDAGRDLLDYGDKHSYIRGIVLGHCALGMGHSIDGNITAAIESFEKGAEASGDPMYFEVARVLLGISYISNGQIVEAEDVLQGVVNFSREFGVEFIGTPAQGFLGAVYLGKGDMSRGLKMIRKVSRSYFELERRYWYAMLEYTLGKVFLQISEGSRSISLSMIFKNIGFLLKNFPFVSKKAEYHFSNAIAAANEIGAKGLLVQAYSNLGLLHRAKRRKEKARESILKAMKLSEEIDAVEFLQRSRQVLESLS